MMALPGGKICNESSSMIQARVWYRANRASSESKSRDSGNPHHAHLCGNMSHPRTNIIENDHRTMRRTNHHHAPNHRRRA
ncbi:hypothetical protein BIFBIF_01977 [Bifidobacterium bifidum ATCC 29521 = JCM 1255 = DSM 20456]|nr:hypothetical protein BIFBIF_01977 [Bifidobacterium bifidum ATCC 29521 = JCM 1255 = DSM 20456]